MNFGKLLAASRSMVPGYETGRYRMRERLHLPHFISPKNPFTAEATGAAPVENPTPTETRPVVSAGTSARCWSGLLGDCLKTPVRALGLQPREGSVSSSALTRRCVGVSKQALGGCAAAAKWSGAAVKRSALWCLDHNPFSSIGRPRLPALPRFGRPPVQEELSLEKVAVVRGDLAHADLEVVQKSRGEAEMSNAAWRSLTARVFGGGAR